jgi:four helix bundle protein
MAPTSGSGVTRSPERLQERLVAFAVAVWEVVKRLPTDPAMARLGDQAMRAATSVAANYAEARAAESRRDFIHKMHICLKELRETAVWLEILEHIDDTDRLRPLAAENEELTRIFVSSIKTAKKSP